MKRWFGLLALAVSLSFALLVISSLTALALPPDGDNDAATLADRRSYPGWVQVNDGGFGDPANRVGALAGFNGFLYAATQREVGTATVWRSDGSGPWGNVMIAGWSPSNSMVLDMKQFGANLYLGTYNDAGGEIWRTNRAVNGATWEKVAQGGLGDSWNSAA